MRAPSSYEEPKTNGPKTNEEVLNAIQVDVGVKNFEQILHTMSEVTGINPQNNGRIRSVYASVSTSLPSENDVKTFMASHQVAVTRLAAEFCNETVNDVTRRTEIWRGFDFNIRSQNAFTEQNRLLIINKAIEHFWIVASDSEMATAQRQLVPMFDELLVDETNNNTTTLKVVKAVCTVILSSAQVTLL